MGKPAHLESSQRQIVALRYVCIARPSAATLREKDRRDFEPFCNLKHPVLLFVVEPALCSCRKHISFLNISYVCPEPVLKN